MPASSSAFAFDLCHKSKSSRRKLYRRSKIKKVIGSRCGSGRTTRCSAKHSGKAYCVKKPKSKK